MKVDVLAEYGYDEALLGLGLSHGLTSAIFPDGNGEIKFPAAMTLRLAELARKLAKRDGGHNKFLEAIGVWLDITAPRYWWSQFDTYRVGVSRLSESTMHTITKRQLTPDDFEDEIFPNTLAELNVAIALGGAFLDVKANLPESFLQRRIVTTNYKALRNIVQQRESHRLPQWQNFCHAMRWQLAHPEFLGEKRGSHS